MATKRITFTGKARFCKPWPNQIDREFEEEGDSRGGNVATDIVLDEASHIVFKALGTRAKAPEGVLKVRRYERHPVLGELGPVVVTGVDEGTLIGNDSDIKIEVDVYDYSFKGRPSRAMRWVSVDVLNLVPYEKKEDKPKVAENAAPFDVPVD